MSARVLVAMDDSEMAEKALEFALETYPDGQITVLTVIGVPSWFMGEAVGLTLADDLSDAMEARARDVHDCARALASERDTEIDTDTALGTPSRTIVEHAAGFDVVVIGSHGRDISSRLLLGNVAETVARRSPVPVIVVR